jgi:TolB-like protein
VIGFVAYALSVPQPPEVITPTVDSTPRQRTIAVLAFEDLQAAGEGEDVGVTVADELRSSLTRVPGLRVLGPETSKALGLAGDGRLAMAQELAVTALLLGEILLDGGQLRIDARLVGVPAGNEMWSNSAQGPSGGAWRCNMACSGRSSAPSHPSSTRTRCRAHAPRPVNAARSMTSIFEASNCRRHVDKPRPHNINAACSCYTRL